MTHPRAVSAAALAVAAALALGVLPQAAGASVPCPAGMDCLTVSVPLDRSGSVPGTVALPVAVQPGDGPVLLVLGGGPGQGMVSAGLPLAVALAPLVRGHRIAVLDQRGTGVNALLCPRLQRAGLTDLTVAPTGAVEACAARLGRRRAVLTTTETVADLEAVRQALGVERMALAGISYGTYVAARYARAHPGRVSRLVLDSVVPQENVDPLLTASMRHAGRILRRSCARGRCPDITRNAAHDLARLVRRVARRPLSGRLTVDGRLRRVRLDGPALLDTLVTLTSFQPPLYVRFPAAVRAALAGRPRMLLRIAAAARDGNRQATAAELSWGLHTATICADVHFPWGSPASAPVDRRAAVDAAVAAVRTRGPFDAATAAGNGLLGRCLRWPTTNVAPPPRPGPLPPVPILVLAGALDLSTPPAEARHEARRSPTAQLAVVPATGHAVLSSPERCVRQLVRRFFADRELGTPCARLRAPAPLPAAPRSTRHVPGGTRAARTEAVVRDTLSDAVAFVTASGGTAVPGLHGGIAQLRGTRLVLRRFALVPHTPVSGRVRLTDGQGLLRVGGRLRARVTVAEAGARLRVRQLPRS